MTDNIIPPPSVAFQQQDSYQIGDTVTAVIAPCGACNPNGPLKQIQGQILKKITNQSGVWYYLSSGSTIRQSAITSLISKSAIQADQH